VGLSAVGTKDLRLYTVAPLTT